jgi:hypothetical protein
MAAIKMDEGRIFKWKDGSTFKASAQEVGEYLSNYMQMHGLPVLQTEDIVEAAKDVASPMHNDFEWDVYKAAEKHWKERARNLANHIVIVKSKKQPAYEGVPAFTSIEVTDYGRGYMAMTDVISDEEYKKQAIDFVKRQLISLKNKYEKYTQLDHIWKEIRKLEKTRATKAKKK